MIVRIQGEGQYELPESDRQVLDEHDRKLFQAVDSGDELAFLQALDAVIQHVTSSGSAVPNDELVTSEIILPGSDTTMEEAKRLLSDEGYLKAVEA
jgi:hypothetical protein